MRYKIYLVIFLTIILRGYIINIFNNIISSKDNNLEVSIINNKYNNLLEEYNNLIDFKSKININSNYTITNIYKTNYTYHNMYINGEYKLNSEVVSINGLVGIISNVFDDYSEVSYIYNTNMVVKVNDILGCINTNNNGNLVIDGIIGNVSLYDDVVSIYNTYIGKVIDIKDNGLSKSIIVKTNNIDNIEYVGVIEYYDN